MLSFTITAADHCRQAESFLHNLLPGATRGYLQKLLRSGQLQLNGAPVKPETKLCLNDRVTLKESSKTAAFLGRGRAPVDILYEDDLLLVVNKEPGRSVHNTAEDTGKDLVLFCQEYLEQRGTPCKLRPVNRIDRGTSGGVILAKSPTAAGIMGRFIKETGLGKVYLAVVAGELPEEGEIDLPLEGKESLTRYQRLLQDDGAAVVAVWPVSGRTHQIRKHFSATGHPILGDRRYGGATVRGLGGHALHAFAASFPHPATGEVITIYAPLPPGMLSLLEQVALGGWPQLLADITQLSTGPLSTLSEDLLLP
jgi:23S rRNA pseudouridine955/2504/2580 synthase